jgi:DNA-binding transcriptional regulator GbsR (MarR family)
VHINGIYSKLSQELTEVEARLQARIETLEAKLERALELLERALELLEDLAASKKGAK